MKSSSWALCAAAILAGDMGLQLLMTRPMTERVESLSMQVSQLQSGIHQLTDSSGNAMQANDLLASLQMQGQRAQQARAALDQIRRFEREVRSQGQAVGHSMNLVQNIGRLHKQIIDQGEQIKALNGAIEDLSAFQQQVHGLTSAASREHAEVDRAMQLVRELGQLKQDVAAQAKGIDEAIHSVDQLVALMQRATAEAADIDDAISGLDQLSALKQRAVAEAADIDSALGGLDQLAALKQRAASEVEGIEQANHDLRHLGELKERVAVEADGIDIAENQFARLIGLKKSLELMTEQDFAGAASNIAGFAKLRDLIIEGSEGIETAMDYSRQLLAMQDELVERGARIDVARKHADGLLSLENALADDANLNIVRAQDNLNGLVAIERQLNSQDEQIIAAVESLELMSDLQQEFMQRIGDLEGLRTGLTELAMLESSIVRTIRSLQPIVELTNLRRLNGDDLQAIARGMMERRTNRIAAGDPNDLPLGEDFRSLGEEGMSNIPVPIPPTRK